MDGRAAHYLSVSWDPDPEDDTYVSDYAYMLRERDGSIRVAHDRHVEGLFSRDVWLRLLYEAGFRPNVIPIDHGGEHGRVELFVGRKPTSEAGTAPS